MELRLNDGALIPTLGMGTWYLGEGRRSIDEEESALCTGIDAGMSLIDTAEMYGDGRAEKLVGRVLRRRSRDQLFLVSKVFPHNAGHERIFAACEASLRRMGTDYLDLYLLHWRGSVPLQETVDCMETLVQQGKILRWGVSNFDVEDMQELFDCEKGEHCAVNQVLYHLGSRGIEYLLQPWMRRHHVALMAYCPLAQGGRLRHELLNHPAVGAVCKQTGLTPIQVLLAFVLAQEHTIAIPRTGDSAHMRLNAAVMNVPLSADQLSLLDKAFPAPRCRVPLDME
jgi:diketogulonate reductase-like aldo/keto reductase